MWPLIGVLLSLVLGAYAWWRSRAPAQFYAGDVYGMGASSHRRFALLCLGFAVVFLLASVWPVVPSVPFLAVFAVAAILYLSSFVRGFSAEDE